jgi:pseudouridine kinase
MKLALNDMALIDHLNATELSQREGVIDRSSAIILDANLSDSALEYLFHVHGDKTILVDPVSSVKAAKLRPFLDRIDTLKPNRLEAELLADQKINSLDDLPRLADVLHQKGVTRLLISLGSDGAYASNAGIGRFIPSSATQVNNVTGAGDALMAGLAHGQLNQWSWEDGVDFALAAARLALLTDHTINSTMSEQAVLRLPKENAPC